MEEMNFEDMLVHSEELEQLSEVGLDLFEDIYGEDLTHHGVKGQKHGERRYQNPDGSLTPLGRIHYGYGKARDGAAKVKSGVDKVKAKHKKKKADKKRKEALEKARATKAANAKAAAERKKKLEAGKLSTKEMTSEELQQQIDRLKLEQDYKKLQSDVYSTQTVNRGKRFVNKFIDTTIDKVAENSAADLTAQAVKVIMAKGVNAALEKGGFDKDVHTNNKKKN